jgi:cytochrome c-type biogenesis protein CcmE
MSVKRDDDREDLAFSHRVTKNGDVLISRKGKLASTLRGPKASAFIDQMESASFAEQQQVMARMTGNYKRGNERQSKEHPRNRS